MGTMASAGISRVGTTRSAGMPAMETAGSKAGTMVVAGAMVVTRSAGMPTMETARSKAGTMVAGATVTSSTRMATMVTGVGTTTVGGAMADTTRAATTGRGKLPS
ncbi:hypothetical protein VPH35_052999 [Triticum aestivum]